jgi:hypothetical protein
VTVAPAFLDTASDVLCETCGYALQGLPIDGNCPECGASVRSSTVDSVRDLTAFEKTPTWQALLQTSIRIWLRPSLFFRQLRTRVDSEAEHRERHFGTRHREISAIAAAFATAGHLVFSVTSAGMIATPKSMIGSPLFWLIAWGILIIPAMLAAHALQWLVAKLAIWEASWRGMRLNRRVVDRGLNYHVAHVTPACLLMAMIVVGAHVTFWLQIGGPEAFFGYLITLCVAIIVAAALLFYTFWLAMSNMIRANV